MNERLEAAFRARVAVLRVAEPYRAFVAVMRALYPDTLRPASWFDTSGVAAARGGASIRPS